MRFWAKACTFLLQCHFKIERAKLRASRKSKTYFSRSLSLDFYQGQYIDKTKQIKWLRTRFFKSLKYFFNLFE